MILYMIRKPENLNADGEYLVTKHLTYIQEKWIVESDFLELVYFKTFSSRTLEKLNNESYRTVFKRELGILHID